MYLDSESDEADWTFNYKRVVNENGATIEWLLDDTFYSQPQLNARSFDKRTDGDNKDGTYETNVLIRKNAYPGLYRLELDVNNLDDIHGNHRANIYTFNCWDSNDENCSNVNGQDIFYKYVRVINSNVTDAPEED